MLSEAESRSIELSRFVAMVLIVSCHVLQSYDNDWAFVLNVGVQMFFLLSGYLYGAKDSLGWKSFVKGRLVKVYLPYCLFLCFALPILYYRGASIKWNQIIIYFLNFQAFTSPVEGLNHLWFLSILMVGYAITPMIRWCRSKNPLLLLVSLGIVCVVEYCCVQKMYTFFTWLMVYVLGVLLGGSSGLVRKAATVCSVIGLVVSISQIPSISSLSNPHYIHISVWFHVSLAIVLLSALNMILQILKNKGVIAFATSCNSISYEIYLIHHLFCIGAMSLLYLTCWKCLNVVLMLCVTFVLAYGLNKLTMLINKRL